MQKQIIKIIIVLTCAFKLLTAHASNFASLEQSAALMGQANAGTTVADDPSVQFYNPAAMSFFSETQLGISGILVSPNLQFFPVFASNYRGIGITGDRNNLEHSVIVPSFYLIRPVNDRVAVGLGVEIPFGLLTEYDNTSLARYFATRSSVNVININPSISYKINDKLAIGVGFDAQYLTAELDQVFNFTSLIPPILPLQTTDVTLINRVNGWGFGWNGGIYVQPSPNTKFGFGYHSRVTYNPSGSSTPIGLVPSFFNGVIANQAGLAASSINTKLTLPDFMAFSAEQSVTSKWKVMADVAYVNWSTIKKIVLNFNNPIGKGLSPQTIDTQYNNSWRVAVGQLYQATQKFAIRAGLAWDQSPVVNTHREPRVPDNDRYWVTVGTHINVTKKTTLDLSYAHIIFKDATVNQSFVTPVGVPALQANYRGNADLFGAQINFAFS
ncbi:MAG: OmpP1/FadL family transporter [Gammaproteobacteria bacterium]